ncbi:hypothetical protein [Microvirga sp. CF3016]|uniref:hypothetical protein n=1 Tax=Microvirga sp. CF3016 TaxID=3110181 RepID=UPI002E7A6FEA|nr:hypothetical protein [Microvirga sp. CF3016]MEE1610937.1 hypothetical protein [Microvirga sp. CF3016]
MTLRLPLVRYVYDSAVLTSSPIAVRNFEDEGDVTDLEAIKRGIVATIRDEELASSTCYEIEAYARLWPYVCLVHDWDVWNDSRRALRLQVIRWLEGEGAPYDFHQFRSGWGVVGFKDEDAAKHFELRWSRQTGATRVRDRDWNPHPLRSTFEPVQAS